MHRGGALQRPALVCALFLLVAVASHEQVNPLHDAAEEEEKSQYLEAMLHLRRLPAEKGPTGMPMDAAASEADLRGAIATHLGVSTARVLLDTAGKAVRNGLDPGPAMENKPVDFSMKIMLILPNMKTAIQMLHSAVRGSYAEPWHAEIFDLQSIRWHQMHQKPEMVSYIFVHMAVQNPHNSEIDEEAQARLMDAIEWNGNIQHKDVRFEGAVQSAKHLDLEYRMKAGDNVNEEELVSLLKSGRMLAEAKKFLSLIGSPLKLLRIDAPVVGYHILTAAAARREAQKHQVSNGFDLEFHCLVEDTDFLHFKNNDGEIVMAYGVAATARVPARSVAIKAIKETWANLDVTVSVNSNDIHRLNDMLRQINRGEFDLNDADQLVDAFHALTPKLVKCERASLEAGSGKAEDKNQYSSEEAKKMEKPTDTYKLHEHVSTNEEGNQEHTVYLADPSFLPKDPDTMEEHKPHHKSFSGYYKHVASEAKPDPPAPVAAVWKWHEDDDDAREHFHRKGKGAHGRRMLRR
jgi:hypothetical protein